jgi:hypothetical protein
VSAEDELEEEDEEEDPLEEEELSFFASARSFS